MKLQDKFTIIDFHTHPFFGREENICAHADCFGFEVNADYTLQTMNNLGIRKFCGSVISTLPLKTGETPWQRILENNQTALALRAYYQGAYIPGFHIHPDYKDESMKEIERMKALGVNVIGELVPYIHGYGGYGHKNLDEIIDFATENEMVISFHSQGEEEMDEMIKRHKNTVFVAAHPGEYGEFMRHLARMKLSENVYLDLSGTGIFRHGLIRHAINEIGSERILFGTDYPTCSPAAYVGGVYFDELLTDAEKERIFSLNAERILKL